ncbi:hypothetical protein ABT56_20630 [Photobacterium aquae]|uniref:Uncharacterized protein n=1 Tax=Photobacterium aquae TaxID=1195763 RepID=A0A0J1GUR2_9GAMM|nr:cold shock domain-containing protein [Photobacterium aquae]KLV03164.1 hypothetical protein ABT56_20630 [Photobacterium aquae]
MNAQTGIIRSFNPANNTGMITCDLGGDINFSACQITSLQQPESGSMVEFTVDDSNCALEAVNIRYL